MFLRPLRYKEKSMANKLKESETKAVKPKNRAKKIRCKLETKTFMCVSRIFLDVVNFEKNMQIRQLPAFYIHRKKYKAVTKST